MSDPNQPSTPPGWYPDGQGAQRWWDGMRWTDHVRPAPGAQPPPPPTAPQPQQPPYGAAYGQPAGDAGGAKLPGFLGGLPRNALIGIAAGVVAIVLICFVGGIAMVAGGGSPEDVATEYLEASSSGDRETVCELLAEAALDSQGYDDADECKDDAEELMAEFDDVWGGIADVDTEIDIRDVDEDGDEAIVEYELTQEYDGLGGDDEYSYEGFAKLVEEDGDWKFLADCGAEKSYCDDYES